MAGLGARVDDCDGRALAGGHVPREREVARAAHHSTVVSGAVPVAVSGVLSAGSLGVEARAAAVLDLDARDARVGAQAHGERVQAGAPRGRRVTRRICGTLKPAGRAPAVAASAAAVTRARGAAARARG